LELFKNILHPKVYIPLRDRDLGITILTLTNIITTRDRIASLEHKYSSAILRAYARD